MDGKPGGISHSHRKPIIAEPTPVLVIHPEALRYCYPKDVDTQEKIDLMMQASFPQEACPINYQLVQNTEKVSINILKTCDPPSLTLVEKSRFNNHVRKINRWRRDNNIPALPTNLYDAEIRKLWPCCPTFNDDDDDEIAIPASQIFSQNQTRLYVFY